MGFDILEERIVGVKTINKLFYVGFKVLELSKLHLHRFQYEKITKRIQPAKIVFADSESSIYWVEMADF